MAVKMCAVAWGPIEAGCISGFHIFQLHLLLYQIVCIGPGIVTRPELCRHIGTVLRERNTRCKCMEMLGAGT